VVAHEYCRRTLARYGQQILRADQAQNPELADVRVQLPEVVFERGTLSLHVGKKTVTLLHTPGHSNDSISVYVREDKVLFAGDLVMPVPYIVGGDRQAMRASLQQIGDLALDNVVQGHGSVLLRGEIPEALKTSHLYLNTIEAEVQAAVDQGLPKSALRSLDVEQCHKSRIPLNGMVEALHQNNLSHLYDELAGEERRSKDRVSREETLDNPPSP
jgi:glyoxylase-like metal-dependent hydrolase (beta-lactamase superfamily II)